MLSWLTSEQLWVISPVHGTPDRTLLTSQSSRGQASTMRWYKIFKILRVRSPSSRLLRVLNRRLTTFISPQKVAIAAFISRLNGQQSKRVESRRLDDIAALRELETTHTLKIEAEGSEPEVLAGAKQVLSKTLTVLVDCVPERGPKKHATLVPVVNMMLNSGFRCT